MNCSMLFQMMFLFVLVLNEVEVHPFNLNMIMPLPRLARPPLFPPMPSDVKKFLVGASNKNGVGITSGLISNLAVAALERRLGDDASIDCNVQAEPYDLIRGRVGPVVVKGNDWRSPLGMSCRAIEAKVGNCMLDLASVVQRQKLILTTPARGNALVTFNSKDFGNFLTHPLLQAPQYKLNGEIHNLQFLKENVIIDPKTSSVTFFTRFLNSTYRCILTRSTTNDEAIIRVVSPSSSDNNNVSTQMSNILTKYFNSLIFDLEGTFVSYRDMALNSDGNVMIELNILVKKFPSRKLNF